jgi:hypothetical protein
MGEKYAVEGMAALCAWTATPMCHVSKYSYA